MLIVHFLSFCLQCNKKPHINNNNNNLTGGIQNEFDFIATHLFGEFIVRSQQFKRNICCYLADRLSLLNGYMIFNGPDSR